MLTAAVALAVLVPPRYMPSVQAWTFNRFTTFEAIEMAAKAGSQNIELYPGQKLRPDANVSIGPDMGPENTEALSQQLKKFGMHAVAFGVTGIDKDPAKARALFTWAKGLGIGIINTESVDAMDTIEMMVKEFDMRVGFHDHPKRADNPNYRMWDPAYVYSLVKDRDKRIGSCADTGHWVRSGIKPVDALKILKGRVVSSHLKDLNEFSPDGHDVPYGTGVSNIAGVLDEFKKMGFTGSVSVEYEYNWDSNGNEVAQCLGFVRGYAYK